MVNLKRNVREMGEAFWDSIACVFCFLLVCIIVSIRCLHVMLILDLILQKYTFNTE
jgi:uncharacterized RDD family membrane protein YckC